MKDQVYGALVDYWGDLKMEQIKNTDGWIVYAAKITSGLIQPRYLFAVVPASAGRGQTTSLNNLDWISLQTRTTDDYYNVPAHAFMITEEKKRALSDEISVIDRTKTETMYQTYSLPIKIKLLHDPRKNNSLQYPDSLKLYQALETYRCVIELL